MPPRFASYLLVFALATLLSAAAAAVALQVLAVSRCHRGNAGDDRYLAHCTGGTVGDYEHGAVYWELEPGIAEGLRSADVVFLGNSRAMFAFSTDAIDGYFANKGLLHYVLGFGHGERSIFARAVMERFALRPKVLVINTDPFFDGYLSEPGAAILAGRPAAVAKYRLKRLAQRLTDALCGRLPRLCLAREKAIYRSVSSGRWFWLGSFAADGGRPFTIPGPPADAGMVEQAAAAGEAFLASHSIDRRCVVLTGVPMPGLDSGWLATALAAKLGTEVAVAPIDRPATIDGSHVDADTAERWTRELMARMDGLIDRCIH